MSPTVLRVKKYRFFFFSREEQRAHVHVTCPDGEAKFWLEPAVAVQQSVGLSARQLRELQGKQPLMSHESGSKTQWNT